MSGSEEAAFALDRLIHEPNRLAILTVLASVKDADFVFLQRALGLTNGNLSSHLTKLEDAGLVVIEKTFVGKKPRTSAALTSEGRTGIAAHWEQLERLRAIAVQPGSFG
ncbi:transcriptional regulator [Nocardioides sp.]|uniref:winged helix-turn-helix domain-containing protein n=1 Tax=Nocardioides sp. TaxID=35761 RepID=UPI0031FED998|nr:ArsR family transcriptional regulator [Nocardioides sp.]